MQPAGALVDEHVQHIADDVPRWRLVFVDERPERRVLPNRSQTPRRLQILLVWKAPSRSIRAGTSTTSSCTSSTAVGVTVSSGSISKLSMMCPPVSHDFNFSPVCARNIRRVGERTKLHLNGLAQFRGLSRGSAKNRKTSQRNET